MKYIAAVFITSILTILACKVAYINKTADCREGVYLDKVFQTYIKYRCNTPECYIRMTESQTYNCIKNHWLFK